MVDEIRVKEREIACVKEEPLSELDILFGAWIAGLGFIILLLGLSIWVRATCLQVTGPASAELAAVEAQ